MIKLYKEWVESRRLANLRARVSIVEDLIRLPFLSKRFILTEYLLTAEQLERNDEMWKEENGSPPADTENLLEELKEEF